MARSSDAAFPLSLVRDKTFQMRQVRRVLLLTLFFIVQSTIVLGVFYHYCLLYTSPSPRDRTRSRMPSSA